MNAEVTDEQEWSQAAEPFLPTTQQILGSQGVCQLLELSRITAFQEGIETLLKIDAFAHQALGQPVVLVEADPR